MENEEAQQLFVSEPTLIKENKLKEYTVYKLQGSKIPEALSRRYRDFDALRRTFIERWPGIFIPNIPHKKTMGNTDKEIVDLRIEMINRFLKKISNIDYLFNSDEMELFYRILLMCQKHLGELKKKLIKIY